MPDTPPIGVLVMAYGGPNSLDDIEAYLLDVRSGRPTRPELIAEIRERYHLIGGRSPILELTQAQARGIEDVLNGKAPPKEIGAGRGARPCAPTADRPPAWTS